MKISVICVTNRWHFEDVLADDMNRQTFRDFEVIVADDNYDGQYSIFDKHFKPREKLDTDVWNINKAYNDAIDRAEGELLIFLQDFIWIPSSGLQRFWDDYQRHPNCLFAGVGHKARRGLDGVSEVDRKVFGEPMASVNETYWELNWAACPRAIMPRFNEEMDQWYGGENQYVAKKALKNGAQILLDTENRCIAYSQDECGGRPADWEPMHANKEGRLVSFLQQLDS